MSYFKSAATKIAHNSTIPALGANKDLKSLQDLILAEKAILQTLQKLSHDLSKSSECLKIWGTGEGEDLADVLSASTTLFSYVATALTQLATHEQSVREYMKAVRSREENLDDMRRRRKALGAKAEAADKKLQKMGSEHKNLVPQTELLNSLREQIRMMDWEIITEEARLSDFKRTTTKNWMILKFGGLLECAEKATIVGELGRLLIDEIPLEATGPGLPRVAYTGFDKTANLLSEAQRCVGEVIFDPQFVNEVSYVSMPQPSPTHVTRDSGSIGANGNGTNPMHSPHHSPNGVSFPSPTTGGTQIHAGDSVSNLNAKRMSGGYDEFGVADGRDRVIGGTMPVGPTRNSIDGFRSDSMGGPSASRPRGNSIQFATFPNRTNGAQGGASPGFQLRDEPVSNVPQETFSSEVNKALQNEPRTSEEGRYSPAPTYESHWNAQATIGLPKGAAPPQPNNRYSYMHNAPSGPRPAPPLNTQDVPLDVHTDALAGESDEDGSLLPYTRDEGDVGGEHPHHIRFGNEEIIPETIYRDEKRKFENDDNDPQSLSAAAAREISREMDALNFQPPSRSSTADQTPSPSQFPAPPSFGFTSPPRSGTPTQDTRNERDVTSSLPLRPPQPPFAQGSLAGSYPLAPPAVKQVSRTPSPAAGSVYSTPNEISGGNPFPGRSVSSPVSQPIGLPGTPRTISAAAFKRPQIRTASGPVASTDIHTSSSTLPTSQIASGDGIGPLSIKKRPMPSTPYPVGRGPGMTQIPPPPPLITNEALPYTAAHDEGNAPMHSPHSPRETSPPRPGVSNIVTSTNEQGESSTHDIISSYENRGNGSPVQEDYGHLGHVRVMNAEEGGSGYSQGNFTTNLDESGSLR